MWRSMRGTRLDFISSKRCYPSSIFGSTPVAQSRVSFRRVIDMSSHEDSCIMHICLFVFSIRCVHLVVGRCSKTSGCRTSMEFNSCGSSGFYRTLFALGALHDPSCDQLSHDYTVPLHDLRPWQVVRIRRVGT